MNIYYNLTTRSTKLNMYTISHDRTKTYIHHNAHTNILIICYERVLKYQR